MGVSVPSTSGSVALAHAIGSKADVLLHHPEGLLLVEPARLSR